MTDRIIKLHDKANALLDRSCLREAFLIYEEIVSINEDDAEARLMMGVIKAEAGDVESGIADIEHAVKIKPDFVDAYYTLAHIYRSQNNQEKMVSCLEKAVEYEPDFTDAWNMLSAAYGEIGDYDKSEKACLSILAQEQDNVNAWVNLANSYSGNKNYEKAVYAYTQAVKNDSGQAQAWNYMGANLIKLGKFEQARVAFTKVQELNAIDIVTYTGLGEICIELGEFSVATERLKKALNIDSENKRAWALLFSVCKKNGALDDFVNFCTKLLGIREDNVAALLHYSFAQEFLGRQDIALGSYQRVLEYDSKQYQAYERVGSIYAQKSENTKALIAFKNAIDNGADSIETLFGYAKLLRINGIDHECAECCRRILLKAPEYIPASIELGLVYIDMGEFNAAIEILYNANEKDQRNPDIVSALSQVYDRIGDYSSAYNLLRPMLNNGNRDPGVVCSYASISGVFGEQVQAIALIDEVLKEEETSTANKMDLNFMAGSLYDALGQYQNAFPHFVTANKLKPVEFEQKKNTEFINALINAYQKTAFDKLPTSSYEGSNLIFIIGMLRSGTSLTEQILSSHADVCGRGELMDITNSARELGIHENAVSLLCENVANIKKIDIDRLSEQYLNNMPSDVGEYKLLTDKMPGNYLYVGLIAMMFPGARFIHVKRDPLDICLSCYFINFSGIHDYSYDLSDLASYYLDYNKLMECWKTLLPSRIFEIEYESMVEDTEATCKNMLRYCDLSWDENILRFDKSERIINTASYKQVKKGIYRSSIKRWENYAKYLDELKSVLNTEK